MPKIRSVLISFLLVLLICNTTRSQIRVEPCLSDGTAVSDAIIFSLPQTCLLFEVEVERTEYTPGPYAAYASKVLGLSGVSLQRDENFYLKSVVMHSFHRPDPNHWYCIKIEDWESKDPRKVDITLSPQSYLTSLSLSGSESKEVGSVIVREEAYASEYNKDYSDLFPYLASSGVKMVTDTIVRRISLDTTIYEDISYNQRLVSRTAEEKASDAAERIFELRDQRFKLLTGYQEVAYEDASLKYMDAELQKMERAYTALFTGVKRKDVLRYTFLNIPSESQEAGEYSLFRFSIDKGFLPASSGQGEEVVLELVFDNAFTQEQESAIIDKIPFRSAVPVYLEVKYGNRNYCSGIYNILQFGRIQALPLSTGISVQFDAEKGLIYRFRDKD